MKHCKKCGAQLADDDDYCYFCGSKLEEEKEEIRNDNLRFNNSYDNNYQHQYVRKNGLAIAGFVVAFFSPIVGLVLSIIGLNKSKTMDGDGRGMAIAGIVVAILNFLITVIIYAYIMQYYGE